MVRVEVEPSGKALVFSAIALSLLGASFLDMMIFFAALGTAFLLLYAFIVAILRARWIEANSRVKPEELSLRLIAGSSQTLKVFLEATREAQPRRLDLNLSLSLSLKPSIRFCSFRPQPCRTDEGIPLGLEFSPKIAGLYGSDALELGITSPLNAFKAWVDIPFKVKVTVIPRVVAVAVRALELVASMGSIAYDLPLQTIGRGTEYAETREYMPGDDLRRLDWKATARLQKLMVRQYHQEAGGKLGLFYDLKTAGPLSKDRAATEFLNNAVALAQQNLPYTITILGEKGDRKTLRFKDGRTALLAAIKMALDAVEVDYGLLYELMDPQGAEEASMLLRILGEASIEEGEKAPKEKEREREEPFSALAITCLLGDLTWLIELHERARRLGGSLRVRVPSQIWLESPTLEEAYIDFERQMRITASLRRRGIEVEGRRIPSVSKAYVHEAPAHASRQMVR